MSNELLESRWGETKDALLEGLDKLINQETNLPVRIADDPLTCVARGGGVALDMISKHSMGFLAAE